MGIEFIRSRGGKPYAKRWADGLDRTKSPQLIGMELTGESRTITAVLTPGGAPKTGATVLVQATGAGDLLIYDGLKAVARIAAPPAGVTADVTQHHGMIQAVVERVGGLGQTVELRLK